MTNQHRATPDDWAQQEDWANRSACSDSSCIIELRGRIEALEVRQQPQQDKLDRLIAIDRDDSANSLVDRIATDAELCQVYNDAPEHGFGPALRAVYDLGREHGAAPTRPGPAGSAPDTDARQLTLVERLAVALLNAPRNSNADTKARTVIFVVAAAILDRWDSEGGSAWETAKWLGQEANR
jgi:hypothetical protein